MAIDLPTTRARVAFAMTVDGVHRAVPMTNAQRQGVLVALRDALAMCDELELLRAQVLSLEVLERLEAAVELIAAPDAAESNRGVGELLNVVRAAAGKARGT